MVTVSSICPVQNAKTAITAGSVPFPSNPSVEMAACSRLPLCLRRWIVATIHLRSLINSHRMIASHMAVADSSTSMFNIVTATRAGATTNLESPRSRLRDSCSLDREKSCKHGDQQQCARRKTGDLT